MALPRRAGENARSPHDRCPTPSAHDPARRLARRPRAWAGRSSRGPAPGDFDFFLGDWNVRHRRLAQRLVGSNEWEEYAGTTRCQAILGGIANFNDSTTRRAGATYRSLGLARFRCEDEGVDGLVARRPQSDAGRRRRSGAVRRSASARSSPTTRSTASRFACGASSLRSRAHAAQWEQAFSPDGGRTWETNYVMHYTR